MPVPQVLNDADIDALLQQVRGKAVAQGTCTFITELPSVGLHTGAILTDEGSNETRPSLLKASRKGRETAIALNRYAVGSRPADREVARPRDYETRLWSTAFSMSSLALISRPLFHRDCPGRAGPMGRRMSAAAASSSPMQTLIGAV